MDLNAKVVAVKPLLPKDFRVIRGVISQSVSFVGSSFPATYHDYKPWKMIKKKKGKDEERLPFNDQAARFFFRSLGRMGNSSRQ
jgi:hypothetical protein